MQAACTLGHLVCVRLVTLKDCLAAIKHHTALAHLGLTPSLDKAMLRQVIALLGIRSVSRPGRLGTLDLQAALAFVKAAYRAIIKDLPPHAQVLTQALIVHACHGVEPRTKGA